MGEEETRADLLEISVEAWKQRANTKRGSFVNALLFDEAHNVGLRLTSLIEELAKILGVDHRHSVLWQCSGRLVEARTEMLKYARAFYSARKLYEAAERRYTRAWLDCYLPFLFHNIYPHTDEEPFDPRLWFRSAEELVKTCNEVQPDWHLDTATLRYFVQRGLIPKAVRVGPNAKGFYSPTTLLRLALIFEGRRQGLSLGQIKDLLPQLLDSGLQHHPELKRLVDPRVNRFVTEMVSRVQQIDSEAPSEGGGPGNSNG